MKYTIEQVIDIHNALSGLRTSEMSGSPIYKTAQNLVKLEAIIKAYNNKRTSLIEKHANGKSKIEPSDASWETFVKEHQAELLVETDLELSSIVLNENSLPQIINTPQTLATLVRENLVEVKQGLLK